MYCSAESPTTKYQTVLEKFHDVTLEKLREALKDECDIRNSSLIQELYDAVVVNHNRSEEVEDIVQNMIVMKFFPSMTTDEYRTLLSYYRNDLKDDAFFMKHNIMTDCPLPPGQIRRKITDFSLYTLENLEAVNLNQLIDGECLHSTENLKDHGEKKGFEEKSTIILASSST
jgi:hypothetical protein